MIFVFLADGFEETEAVVTIDILRRAGLEVSTVGVGGSTVYGSHKIPIVCDITTDEALSKNFDCIILPGGMPGTINLEKDAVVQKIINKACDKLCLICAICAAPLILGHKGMLKGLKSTCYSGFENQLFGAVITNETVVKDGNIITANGPGAAFEFGFAIVDAINGNTECSDKLRDLMKYK